MHQVICAQEFQRMTWDALRKSLNGLVNKVNIMNIKQILPEFFGEVRCPMPCSAKGCVLRTGHCTGHS
jgi:hypothetical protein